MKNKSSLSRSSPLRLLLIVLLSIFLAEGTIMLSFDYFTISLSPAWLAILDALLISTLIFPVLYIFHYKPMVSDIKILESAEKTVLRSEKRFKDVAATSGEWIWETDLEGKYTYASPTVENILGYKPEDVVGKHYYDFIHAGERESVKQNVDKVFSRQESFVNLPSTKVHKDGHTIICETSGAPFLDSDGAFMGYRGGVRDITERKMAEEALSNISVGFSHTTGKEFFNEIVRHLGKTLDMKYVFIGELAGGKQEKVRILALCVDGEIREPLVYDLKDTPCANVVGQNVCSYIHGVQEIFPKDIMLREMGAESYCGTPLFNTAGQPLGIVALISDKPLVNKMIVESTMLTFADRVSSELERMIAQEEIFTRMGSAEFSAKMGATLTKSGTMDDILQQCAGNMVDYLDAAFARIWLYNQRENILELKASAGLYTHLDGPHSRFPLDKPGKITDIANQRKSYLTNSFMDDPAISDREWAVREKIMSFAGFPLVVDEKLVGVIAMFAKHVLPESIIETLGAVADEVAIGVERKLIEEERARLSMAIEQAAEAFIITDDKRRIQYANPAFEKITGYTSEEAIGKPSSILDSGKHDEAFYRNMQEILDKRETWRSRCVNRKKDGSFYDVDCSMSPVLDKSGKVTNYISIQRDITKEASLEKQVQHAQKMEAIGAMAGGIAHDFNNILSIIIGYSELTVSDIAEDDPANENLRNILNAAFRAKDLVRQILTFSRKEEHELRSISLAKTVSETLKLVRASLPSNIKIIQDINPDSGYVMANPMHIQQVVLNLCANSEHAMREKGGGVLDVKLETMTTNLDESDFVSGADTDRRIKLTVSDTGYGIEKELIDRIFDPFFTTKSTGEGTGLGLAAVHGIVTNHGGAIAVFSEPGEGTTFTIYFPVTKEKNEEVKKETDFIPHGKELILFVDDEESLAEMGRQVLERFGYEVITAYTAEEALEIFNAKEDKIDVVITDQTMPGMTGGELTEELLKIRHDLPVIVCSGFSNVMNKEKALELGARDFIIKPVLSRDLGIAIRRALEQ